MTVPSQGSRGRLSLIRESIELAFLTANQLLPPRQRAALIMRDVLGWSAAEVGDSPGIVGGVGQYRAATRPSNPRQSAPAPGKGTADKSVSEVAQQSVLARYIQAWEEGDMNALALLLKEDSVLTMAPAPNWFHGRSAIATFFRGLCFSDHPRRCRLLPTGANWQPACAAYEWEAEAGRYRFSGIRALRLKRSQVDSFNQRDLDAQVSGYAQMMAPASGQGEDIPGEVDHGV